MLLIIQLFHLWRSLLGIEESDLKRDLDIALFVCFSFLSEGAHVAKEDEFGADYWQNLAAQLPNEYSTNHSPDPVADPTTYALWYIIYVLFSANKQHVQVHKPKQKHKDNGIGWAKAWAKYVLNFLSLIFRTMRTIAGAHVRPEDENTGCPAGFLYILAKC